MINHDLMIKELFTSKELSNKRQIINLLIEISAGHIRVLANQIHNSGDRQERY